MKTFSLKLAEVDCSRLGSTSQIVEGYLSNKEKLDEKKLIYFFSSSNVANKQINKMVARTLKISKISFFFRIVKKCVNFWKIGHEIFFDISKYSIQSSFDKDPNYKYDGPRLTFSKNELRAVQKKLNQLGISDSAKWICIHNRDSSYLKKKFPNVDFSYHNYRDFTLKSMEKLINYFSKKGIYVLRMGSIQEEVLKLKDKKIIDYANSELRNPTLDIYLLSNSLFYFGSSSGLMNVSSGFNRKCYGINYVLPEFTRQHVPYLFIFKKIRNKKNQNYLSLKEILESPFVDEIQKNNINKYGYELVNNTDEEIYNLGIEALKDHSGENVYDEESAHLLEKFYKIYQSYRGKKYKHIDFLKISPFFLKNNKYLLN
jgi:putative glycosyltransferase (TIGR04372 family)